MQKANPLLRPETIRTTEAVLEQSLDDNVRFSASFFHNRMKDLIGQRTDPSDGLIQYQNAGEVKARGVEGELRGHWDSGRQGRASYTLQQSQVLKIGGQLANSPAHMVKLSFMEPLLERRLYLGTNVLYMSRRGTSSGEDAKGFALVNLTLSTGRLVRALEFSASVYNVLNKRYGDPGAEEHAQTLIPQDGRTFRITIGHRF